MGRQTRITHVIAVAAGLAVLSGFVAAGEPPAPGFLLVAEDDCGAQGRQSNLVRGSSGSLAQEELNGADLADPRLKTFNHGEIVDYRYAGLKANARYKLRVFCLNGALARSQTISAEDFELSVGQTLPSGKVWTAIFDLPSEICRDGILDLRFRKTGSQGALVSAIELWSDTPGLLGPPENLIRFRIDKLPTNGQTAIGASLKIHRSPWNVTAGYFGPAGRIDANPQPYEKTGFTPWYNLNALPSFGGECSLLLSVGEGAEGVTQFGSYTNAGAPTREIRWGEPDGLRISFVGGIGPLGTFRDQERNNYRITLDAGKGRLFPLTRPPLLFANAWGKTTGGAAEYMVKSFRLLGLNSVTTLEDAAKYEKLYGWGSAEGHYWPPFYFAGWSGDISDEPAAAAMTDTHYRKYFAEGPWKDRREGLRVFQICDEPGEQKFSNAKVADAAFREWAAAQKLKPALFGKKLWSEVSLRWDAEGTPDEKRLYYWSRKYRAYATPKALAMACASARKYAPGKDVKAFVALSGHQLYFGGQMSLDMFQLAQYPDLTPGISDWMNGGTWWWDSHQSVAFSVAPFNAGARRYGRDFGKPPIVFPMMHCVEPSFFRAFTQLANQCKLISYYNYGPSYEVTEGYWSGGFYYHCVVQEVNNLAAQVDDILGPGLMRPSRVALLYSMSTEIWAPKSSFVDKRASFLALSHEYFQPELVTEDQIEAGALAHYDALYVLDANVKREAQDRILKWVGKGGLLWTCSEALTRDEVNEPYDSLNQVGLKRTLGEAVKGPALRVEPDKGEAEFAPHNVPPDGRPQTIAWEGARVRARYGDGMPAWLEHGVGKGRIVYLGHRGGLSYSRRARQRGDCAVWPESGRSFLTQPLIEANISRELTLSVPFMMAMPISTDAGTVILLYNMNAVMPTNLTLTLKEPAPPLSVQAFDGQKNLIALPFEYEKGLLHIHLARLLWYGGNMLLVRRSPPPPDDRLTRMRQAAKTNLIGDDWQALSAGAWFAGFFPDWGLGPRLVPLLKHAHWAVRRSAAESLGRLGWQEAGDALLAAAAVETDAHALADEIQALAKLGRPETEALCQRQILSGDPFRRTEAARALQIIREKSTQE